MNNITVTKSIYELLETEIRNSDLSPDEKTQRLSRLMKVKEVPVNLMLVGATGSGKSSTINALFNMEKARVGVGVDPETTKIESFRLDNLTIWDTPGLGDSKEADHRYMKMIQAKLGELDKNGDPLIDLVLVVLDASQKDLGTTYDCINTVLIPSLGKDAEHRILIALNQADAALKGNHWDRSLNEPDMKLRDYLEKKAASVGNRIRESTGIFFRPVYYSAGFKEEGEGQQKPYNLTKLLSMIVAAIPKEKRLSFSDTLNPDHRMWESDDGKADYKDRIRSSFYETVYYWIQVCADSGSDIGSAIMGEPGSWIGKFLGGFTGIFVGTFNAIFKR